MGRKLRILLSPGYHAEAGETKGHQHSVYTTVGELHGYKRIHVGTLMKSAVDAWADAANAESDHLAEEAECAHMWLDRLGTPRSEQERALSLVGRIRTAMAQPVRSFPEAADGSPTTDEEVLLFGAGCDPETARFVARQLSRQGVTLVRTRVEEGH